MELQVREAVGLGGMMNKHRETLAKTRRKEPQLEGEGEEGGEGRGRGSWQGGCGRSAPPSLGMHAPPGSLLRAQLPGWGQREDRSPDQRLCPSFCVHRFLKRPLYSSFLHVYLLQSLL